MNQAFAAKYRRKVFTAQIINELSTIFAAFCLQFNSELIDFDGEDDRVYPVILYPPQLVGSPLVFKLKGTSSMLIRKRKYPAVRAKLWGNALVRCLFCIIMHRSSHIYYPSIY
ncbi:transposase [Succinatimonas hippei]|uniref:transposase n=1 Tax=Succinatimonas hippei TaxID=626938 RepID=UPI0023F67F95|nr:transposase [Succinatimonas hippei]